MKKNSSHPFIRWLTDETPSTAAFNFHTLYSSFSSSIPINVGTPRARDPFRLYSFSYF